MAIFELDAIKRDTHGSAAARRLRNKENMVPAVIYGGDSTPESISLNHDKIVVALSHEAFYSHVLTLNVDGKSEKVVIKALQRHPYKSKVLHADFLRVKANEKLIMNIPLHFKGAEEAPGAKEQNGVITHHINDVEVSCLPANLPEFIDVDISQMKLDDVLHLSHLKLPKGVEIVALGLGEDHDGPVVSIHEPRAAEEEPSEATAEGENDAKAEGTNAAKNEKSAEEKKD